jgi:hypothetical protein
LPLARVERRHEDHRHRGERRPQRRRAFRVAALDVGDQPPQMTRDRERRRRVEGRRQRRAVARCNEATDPFDGFRVGDRRIVTRIGGDRRERRCVQPRRRRRARSGPDAWIG